MFKLANGEAANLPKLYGTSAWIMGAGPSMRDLTEEERCGITRSPAIRFALNHGGRGPDGSDWLVKPTHWTAYDNTVQFSPSVFRDPTITKFVRPRRMSDLVPDGKFFKMADMPNVVQYDMKDGVDHINKFNPELPAIWDNRDSLCIAMSIAIHLGCRKLYLIGTDMKVVPSEAQQAYALKFGVTYPVPGRVEGGKFLPMPNARRTEKYSDKLADFVLAIASARKVDRKEVVKDLASLDREVNYSMSETKNFESVINTDGHYHWIADHLRMARLSMMRYGIEVVSCCPTSRLNSFFPYKPVLEVCEQMKEIGDVTREQTKGSYIGERAIYGAPHHTDVVVYRHPAPKKAPPPIRPAAVGTPVAAERVVEPTKRLPVAYNTEQLENGL